MEALKKINWRSKALWGSITSGALLIVQGLGFVQVPEQSEPIQYAVNGILIALVSLGVLTNTTK